MWLLDTNTLIYCHKFSKKKLFREDHTFTTIFCLIEYPIIARYEEITIFYPSTINYKEGIKYAVKLRERGIPIPTVDILNGTIAIDKNIYLVSDDKHYELFQSIEPSLKLISIETYIENIQKIH